MRSLFNTAAVSVALTLAWLVGSAGVMAQAEPEKKKPVPKHGGPGGPEVKERPTGDPLRNLSPNERERFREAMKKAWSDPAVLQAREEVKEATTAYQRALIDAIKRSDPEVVALMNKVKPSPDSPIKSLFSGGGPGGRGRPGGGFRDFESYLTGERPAFLKQFSEEQQKIYAEAREKAMKSPEFQEVVGKLKELRKNDEAMRNERIELFGKVRQTLHKQMIAADERIKALVPKEEFTGPPRRGPGNGPPQGRKRPQGENPGGPKPPPVSDR